MYMFDINIKKKAMNFFVQLEKVWCKVLNIYNPYRDPWKVRVTKCIPDFDGQAYKQYPEHNFVYDKLFIARSQSISCGTLEDLLENKHRVKEFPIFIKPRYGHKSASSKNCYKIHSFEELKNYKEIPDMMWSEFINDTEGMTDFFIHNGTIVYQITYLYSETQHGVIADDWKYISPDNNPPEKIVTWTQANMKGFTGVCNVQYRGTKIIEVGLRLARGGAYVLNTKNERLIKSINTLCEHKVWDYDNFADLSYEPFYSFKCYTEAPVLYLYPQHLLDYVMKTNNCLEFYEYYFEPSGKTGMVFLQYLHKDFDEGMQLKKKIEQVFTLSQYLFFMLFMITIIAFAFQYKHRNQILIVFLVIFATRFINAIVSNYNLLNAQKQSLLH